MSKKTSKPDEEELKEDSENTEKGLEDAEESELEEVIEKETKPRKDILDFDNLNLRDFSGGEWKISGSKAPVLEEITVEQEGPRFVGTGTALRENANATREESGEVTYIPKNEDTENTYLSSNEGEATYTSGREQVSLNPKRVNVQKIRFDTAPRTFNQQDFSTTSREASFGGGWNVESINVQTQRISPEEVGRGDPLDADLKKYENYDPNRPSAK